MTTRHPEMRTQSRGRLIGGVVFPLLLFVSVISLPRMKHIWATAAMAPESENSFEFANNESEDARDLYVKWSRAINVKSSDPFKKVDGSGKSTTDFSNGTIKNDGGKASIRVSWDGTDPEVKEWWWTRADGKRLGQVKTGNPTSKSERAPATSTVQDGLRIVTFDTREGRIIVNLPDDMRAGDTISGTVVAEPKGQSPEERTRNLTALNGYVIELETPKKPDGTSNPLVKAQVTATLSPFTFTLPPSSPPTPPLKSVSSGSSSGLGITLKNTSGSFTVGGPTTVPIEMVSLSLQSSAPLKLPQLPAIGQQGRPVEIIGPFQVTQAPMLIYGPPGATVQDFEKNTEYLSGGFGLIQPLAESPRKCVFRAPTNVVGPIELYLKEGDSVTKGTYRNLGVNLTAPKTSLMKGESTELHVEVQGLQGIKEPVPLRLTKGGVVTMQGGDIQMMSIKPAEVQTNGTYTTTRTITGVQTGAWNATATVVVFNVCLQDDKTGNQLQFNSTTGDYRFCNLFPTVVAGDSGRTAFSFLGTTTAGDSPPCQGTWHGHIADMINGGPTQIGDQGQIQIQINKCTQTGGASGYFYQQVSIPSNASPKKINFTITDRDTRNNTCVCK